MSVQGDLADTRACVTSIRAERVIWTQDSGVFSVRSPQLHGDFKPVTDPCRGTGLCEPECIEDGACFPEWVVGFERTPRIFA